LTAVRYCQSSAATVFSSPATEELAAFHTVATNIAPPRNEMSNRGYRQYGIRLQLVSTPLETVSSARTFLVGSDVFISYLNLHTDAKNGDKGTSVVAHKVKRVNEDVHLAG
jgi:hypothetical protein